MSIITNTPSLCLYANHKDKIGKAISYQQLLNCVSKPPQGKATDPTQVKAKKSTLPLVTPFISADLTKTKEAALGARYGALVIDFDKEKERTLEGMAQVLKQDWGLGEFCGFTTSSHTLGDLSAFKFVIPLATFCDAHQYSALAEGLCLLLDTDPAQARKTQGFYAPCDMISPSVYEKHINNGELLSPSSQLWKAAIDKHLENTAQKAPVKPRTHVGGDSGIFDLINKHYTLESLLSAAGHTQKDNKWLSPHSQSGIAGGVIFDTANGKRFYSHSSSCPLGKDAHNGHSLDVADVLAVTRYGGNYAEMVRCEAPIVDAEGQRERRLEYQQARQPQPTSTAWGELVPLQQAFESKPLQYPLHHLPEAISAPIQAIAKHVQVPIAMAAQCVLGAITHIAQARVNAYAPHDINGMPCSLFLLTEGLSPAV